jgi:hypothetical protein
VRQTVKLICAGVLGLTGLLADSSAAWSDGYAVRSAPRTYRKPIVVRRAVRPSAWCQRQLWNLYKFDRRTRGGVLASWDDQRIAASLRSDVAGTCGGYWRPSHRWSYR